ncbi:MAG: hypothetical protein ABSH32_20730 [Bryobacteraceae bacterium]
MPTPRRNSPSLRLDDAFFTVKQRKAIPHEFVLDVIATLSPATRPMFGCLAVYVENKIVLILRDKRDETADNGVRLATTKEHHEESAARVPEHAIHSGTRQEGNGLAGPSGRCAGFRGGGGARLRAYRRQGPSNRQGAGGAAGLGIGSQEGGEIPEAGEGTKERRETSRAIVNEQL